MTEKTTTVYEVLDSGCILKSEATRVTEKTVTIHGRRMLNQPWSSPRICFTEQEAIQQAMQKMTSQLSRIKGEIRKLDRALSSVESLLRGQKT